MPRSKISSPTGVQYTMHSMKIHVLESEMFALSQVCAEYDVQAHRSLVPISDDGSFEVLLQFNAINSGLHTAFLIGRRFGIELSQSKLV